MNNKQIKTKKRVNRYGEVFTADREVNAMLDMIKCDLSKIDKRVLEPAVGEGTFLVKILDRRIMTLQSYFGYLLELKTLQAVSTLYGVDIQEDNVKISRNKLRESILFNFHKIGHVPTDNFLKMLNVILQHNILAGNTITCMDSNNLPIRFSEWEFQCDGIITRRDYTLIELLENNGVSTIKHQQYTYTWMRKKMIQVSYNTNEAYV